MLQGQVSSGLLLVVRIHSSGSGTLLSSLSLSGRARSISSGGGNGACSRTGLGCVIGGFGV